MDNAELVEELEQLPNETLMVWCLHCGMANYNIGKTVMHLSIGSSDCNRTVSVGSPQECLAALSPEASEKSDG